VTDLFESKTCMMDIVKINVNMDMLWANPKIAMLLSWTVHRKLIGINETISKLQSKRRDKDVSKNKLNCPKASTKTSLCLMTEHFG
jgi:hypothetical protein